MPVRPSDCLPAKLLPIVHEPDHTEAERDRDDEPDVEIREIGEEKSRQEKGKEDQHPAHRRRAGLRLMALGTVGADLLADLQRLQATNQRGPEEECETEGEDRREQRSERDVPHHVQRRVRRMERVEEVVEHGGSGLAPEARDHVFHAGAA